MIDHPLRPNTSQIRKLINKAFDDSALEVFCMDHYLQTYEIFGRGMRKDEKITVLLDHCLRNPSGAGVEELLQTIEKDNKELFEQFQPYFIPDSDELVTAKIDSGSLLDLMAELAEWKLIHNETQILLNAMSIPFDYLVSCRHEPDRKKLDDAGIKWQRHCIRKLKNVPDKWQLRYARSSALDDLKEKTFQIEFIRRQLMQIEPVGEEFTDLYLNFEDFNGILWDLLTAADKRLMVLIESLQTEIGE